MSHPLASLAKVTDADAAPLGNAISAELTARGHHVLRFHTVGEPDDVSNLMFVLDVSRGESVPWQKGFAPAVRTATPDEIEAQLEAWKEKVRGQIVLGRAPPVVVGAYRTYGREAMADMLRPKS